MKVIFGRYGAHYSEDDLAGIESDNVFVPNVNDDVVFRSHGLSGKVVSRKVYYDFENLDNTEIHIKLAINDD